LSTRATSTIATEYRRISLPHDSRRIFSQGKSQSFWEDDVETFISRRRPKILIADDHVLIAEAYAKLLEPEYEVPAPAGGEHTSSIGAGRCRHALTQWP
jgi:hypothetical protein